MAERITARAKASVEEALVATSAHRPTLNRPEVMEKLKPIAWLGRVIALQGLLKLVSKMSLTMQTVNVVPWMGAYGRATSILRQALGHGRGSS